MRRRGVHVNIAMGGRAAASFLQPDLYRLGPVTFTGDRCLQMEILGVRNDFQLDSFSSCNVSYAMRAGEELGPRHRSRHRVTGVTGTNLFFY